MEESPRSANSGLSRRGLIKSSLYVGLAATGLSVTSTVLSAGVAHATNAAAYADTDKEIPIAFTVQENWRYCSKCRNLYYAPEGGQYCSGGGSHTAGSSTNYMVPDENPSYTVANGSNSLLQSPWLWCKNCSSLFWGGGEATSWCSMPPAEGTHHDGSGSGAYYLPNGSWIGVTSMQPGWRYCYNCKDLYWGGAWASSICAYASWVGNPNNGGNGVGHAPGNTVYYLFD